jgi:hypothetical protein
VVVIARTLRPDPSGLGTHLQLGLPPCAFLAWTGLPCPSCGLTTAFAYMARLQVPHAVQANPVGVPLFLCACVAIPLCAIACVRAWTLEGVLKGLRLGRVAAIIGLTALLSWLARIAAMS